MMGLKLRIDNKIRRKNRIRSKIVGTNERPRLSVNISNYHVSAQIINDQTSKTLVAATTVGSKHKGTMTEKAANIGKEIASKALKKSINAVVFDRNGRKFSGRLLAFTDAARKEGLEF